MHTTSANFPQVTLDIRLLARSGCVMVSLAGSYPPLAQASAWSEGMNAPDSPSIRTPPQILERTADAGFATAKSASVLYLKTASESKCRSRSSFVEDSPRLESSSRVSGATEYSNPWFESGHDQKPEEVEGSSERSKSTVKPWSRSAEAHWSVEGISFRFSAT